MVLNFSSQVFLHFVHLIQLFTTKDEKKRAILSNPLLVFVVIMAVIFITWAAGEAICWMHGKSHFVFSTKLKTGMFKLGCK